MRETQVCAGGEYGKSACNGDSGGGLYIRREKDKLAPWYLFGIVSFGVPNCQIAKPEVYVRYVGNRPLSSLVFPELSGPKINLKGFC